MLVCADGFSPQQIFCHKRPCTPGSEIVARDVEQNEDSDEIVNFLDAAQGLKYWKQCKVHKGNVLAGYVKIRVEAANETAA